MRNFSQITASLVSAMLLDDAFMGAWTPVYIACTPAGDKGGQYFIAWCRERTSGADQRAWENRWQDAFMGWVDKCVTQFEGST